MKLTFFTNISHEFRTPLTLLRGYIEKLMPGEKDRNSSFALEQIDRNSKRLLTLVDELMDFRKAESGLLKLRSSNGDLVKFTAEIKEVFNELAEQQNIDYTFRSQYTSKSIWFDPGKIEKVLYNLISNALKFTPPGGAIEVSISGTTSRTSKIQRKNFGMSGKEEDRIDISISDTGIGIPSEDIPHIFDRFFQVNDGDDGIMKGTGIGLAFSNRLVEIHKGLLSVQSTINKGSTFTVSLPLGKTHLSKDEIYETDKERFYLRLDYGSILTEKFALNRQPHSDMAMSHGKPLLLIIEDDSQILNLLREILSEYYNVIFALDGVSGLEMVKDENPEIVISDIMMPGKSGIEVCNTVKCDPATSHIPVILLTARKEEDQQLEGLNIGADAFLSKPFSTKLLIATIDNLLVNRQHLREKFAAMDTIAPSDLTRNKIDEHFLQKVISIIENKLNDTSLDVAHLCTQLGMSRSVLYRKIKALTAHSIQEFIRGVRLRKAKQLLINTNKSISEVSYLVGFPNTKHFSTSFRKEFDVSPSEFRK
ncbi:ATP-binding protein [Bacteroidota bacterium]